MTVRSQRSTAFQHTGQEFQAPAARDESKERRRVLRRLVDEARNFSWPA
jgi:Skp family chaperone for outer membrane proteins